MTAVPPTATPAAPPPPAPQADPDRGALTAFVGYGLLFISLFTGGLSGFIAMILAYDRKGQSGPVPATHFAFQLKIFWICFILCAAAGALWIGGLFSLLTHPPLPRPVVPGEPDTQLVSIADAWLRPADMRTWSYRFDWAPAPLPPMALFQARLGAACMGAGVLLSWIAPIYGLARLASGRPMGRPRDTL